MESKRFVLFLSLMSIAAAGPFTSSLDDHWEMFKELFQKTYGRTEEGARRLVFERNAQKIMRHNLEADLRNVSYRLGINKYTDWTREEFSRLNRYKSMSKRTLRSSTFLVPSNVDYPAEVDWRKDGLVTEVKDQGDCGSCWAFSATGAMEAQHKKKTGELVSLSEQNLIDCCDAEDECYGCDGGVPIAGFVYAKKNNGIDTEKSYPYVGKNRKCRFNSTNVGTRVTGFATLPQYDEIALMKAVATVGPISLVINAMHVDFQHYKSGVFDAEDCEPNYLNHGVLVVGYGTENGKEYWLVKNSWGPGWGEAGYIKIARNHENICGIAAEPGYPLL